MRRRTKNTTKSCTLYVRHEMCLWGWLCLWKTIERYELRSVSSASVTREKMFPCATRTRSDVVLTSSSLKTESLLSVSEFVENSLLRVQYSARFGEGLHVDDPVHDEDGAAEVHEFYRNGFPQTGWWQICWLERMEDSFFWSYFGRDRVSIWLRSYLKEIDWILSVQGTLQIILISWSFVPRSKIGIFLVCNSVKAFESFFVSFEDVLLNLNTIRTFEIAERLSYTFYSIILRRLHVAILWTYRFVGIAGRLRFFNSLKRSLNHPSLDDTRMKSRFFPWRVI